MKMTLSKTFFGKTHVATIVAACIYPIGAFAETHTVDITGFNFVPATLSVAVGDTVIWRNLDIVPHTATSNDQTWDTGEIKAGETKQLIFNNPAQGGYFCHYHPMMKANLTLGD